MFFKDNMQIQKANQKTNKRTLLISRQREKSTLNPTTPKNAKFFQKEHK